MPALSDLITPSTISDAVRIVTSAGRDAVRAVDKYRARLTWCGHHSRPVVAPSTTTRRRTNNDVCLPRQPKVASDLAATTNAFACSSAYRSALYSGPVASLSAAHELERESPPRAHQVSYVAALRATRTTFAIQRARGAVGAPASVTTSLATRALRLASAPFTSALHEPASTGATAPGGPLGQAAHRSLADEVEGGIWPRDARRAQARARTAVAAAVAACNHTSRAPAASVGRALGRTLWRVSARVFAIAVAITPPKPA
jgi:hypothetical protein